MKRRHWLYLAALVLLVASSMTGCSLLSVSIDQRISDFFSDLNADRTKVYLNLDPDSTIYTGVSQTTQFWEAQFAAADGPYTYTITSTAPYRAAGVNVTVTGLSGAGGSYVFVFVDRGSPFSTYYISDIRLVSGSTSTSIFGLP